MVKTLFILILLFDGTLLHDRIDFDPPINVKDCLALGDAYREIFSTYRVGDQQHPPVLGIDYTKQGWYLNDGRGTMQGIYCE
tara:strand:- start:310 stop:555 length:246 start_codon:yes stop_codon:yes gene_type:complete